MSARVPSMIPPPPSSSPPPHGSLPPPVSRQTSRPVTFLADFTSWREAARGTRPAGARRPTTFPRRRGHFAYYPPLVFVARLRSPCVTRCGGAWTPQTKARHDPIRGLGLGFFEAARRHAARRHFALRWRPRPGRPCFSRECQRTTAAQGRTHATRERGKMKRTLSERRHETSSARTRVEAVVPAWRLASLLYCD